MPDRKHLWQDLQGINHDTPCLFIGDFNAVYSEDHRKNGLQVTTYETYDMRSLMEDMELHPLPTHGHSYSWSNREEGQTRILTRIDHTIGNMQWMDSFGQEHVTYANA